ncbi:MAG TPA: protein kinase [Kofleriaceae bacterium]|nr:protein kinase [Kofleriaceae bacterium]
MSASSGGDDTAETGPTDLSSPPTPPTVKEKRAAEASLASSDRYVLEQEVAHGGLGRVYQAWDKRLRRRVVVKELMASRAFAEDRFLREAMVTAQLEHPSIVPIHDAGRLPSGQPFYAMKQVVGETLAKIGKAKATLAERLALLPHLVAVAEAIAYAHSRGIIHRDLKPQNVLLGPFGETVVIDWGLAKRVAGPDAGEHETPLPGSIGPVAAAPEGEEGDDEPALTEAGAVLGTPAYMPIEQARGGLVDERADVYAIGAMLYFVLAGHAPYRGATGRSILRQLEAAPPVPIDRVVPDAPRELVAIVAKAMARDMTDRYPSAKEVAIDLAAYQTGQIVGAHRYSTRERLARWARRYRLPLAVAAVLVAILVIVATVSIREIVRGRRRAEAARATAEAESAAARHRAAEVLREGAEAALARGEPLEARAELRGSLEIEDSTDARALWQAMRAQPLAWRRDLGAAIHNVGFSPDGTILAAASQDHSIYLVDVATQETRVLRGQPDQVTSLAWAPDGKHLATGAWNGDVRVWDLASGSARVLAGHTAATWALAYAPDGRTLVSGSIDRTARVWDAERGEAIRVIRGHDAEVNHVAISGDRMISCSSDGSIKLWSLATGALVKEMRGHALAVLGCDVTPDGTTIASASWDGTVKLWRASDGANLATLRGHHDQLQTVRFSPDGKRVASGGADHDIIVWDVASASIVRRLHGDFDRVTDLDWSPDGRYLASGGNDDTLRLWDLSTPPAEPARGHALPVVSVAASPDGRLLASGSYDKSVRVWDAATGEELAVFTGHTQRVHAVAFVPGAARVVSGSADGTARVWDLATGAEVLHVAQQASIYDVAVSPDGKTLLTAGTDYIARLWDLSTGALVGELRGHTDRIYTAIWSADGALIATGSYDTTARVWDVASRKTTMILRGHHDAVDGLAFTGDGRLVTGGEDRSVRVWDLATGQGRVLADLPGRVYRLALDRDHVYAAGSDGLVHVVGLDGSTRAFAGHRGEVDDVVVLAGGSGTKIASGSDDGTLRVWDASTGAPAWRAPLLVRGVLETHRGWIAIDPAATIPADAAWKRAIEARAARASVGPDGAICAVTIDGAVERWDVARDARAWAAKASPSSQVIAIRGACAILDNGRVTIADRSIAEHATAIASDGDGLLVADDRSVTSYAGDGSKKSSTIGAPAITALLRTKDTIVLGFANGGVESIASLGHAPAFRDAPSAAVTALAAGPGRTIVVGFANGVWGLWDPSNGAKLRGGRLHGPVVHLAPSGDALIVATELGDHARVELGALAAPYCDVMRAVWADVPVVWEGGLVVRRDPPAAHPCR